MGLLKFSDTGVRVEFSERGGDETKNQMIFLDEVHPMFSNLISSR